MKSILNIFVYFIELFSTGKSFESNPIIGSSFLNRCGLHVIRLFLSHSIMRMRMLVLSRGISAEDRKQYLQQGYLLKENYLPDDVFSEIEIEARNFKGEVREARQGDTITERAVLSPCVLDKYPKIRNVLLGSSFQKFTRFTSGHLRDPLYYLEKIKNQYCEGCDDPQKKFHHDTFHPSMKCWLFIDDIEHHSGEMHARGSSRYTKEDIAELDLPEPHVFTVKKNTLVLVNVFGIHRRGDSPDKSTRLALWGDSRTNPFLPFPGVGGALTNKLQYYFLSLYRKSADKASAKKGEPSPWAVISTDKK